MRITLEAAKARYGPIVNQKWADEALWCGFVPLPEGISLVNSATNEPMTRIYCNRDMAAALTRALETVVERNLARELQFFDGCLMIRDVRGVPGALSAHAYALALDFNAHENPLGGPVKFSPAFLACFKDAGFDLGAEFHRVDGMHVSFCWEGHDTAGTPQ